MKHHTAGWSEDLGSKLKALRLARKIKQVDLARSLGISPAYLNLIENNKRPMRVDVLERILSFFAIDMEVFRSASLGVKIHHRFQDMLKDPFLQGYSLGEDELAVLRDNSTLSNLVLSLYQGYKSSRAELVRLERRLHADEQSREEASDRADDVYLLDRTAYDEVTEFLQRHRNYFPDLETLAEDLLRRAGADDRRRTDLLAEILKREFDVEVSPRSFPPGSHLLRLYNERTRQLFVSNAFGPHRLQFQLAHFLALKLFERERIVDGLIDGFGFRHRAAPTLARVNLANYFAGAMLLPYDAFFALVQSSAYDIRAMEGVLGMPFETIAHRLCNLSRPGASGVPLHFIRTDLAGNISKKYSGSGLRIDDRRRSCPKWAVHSAFLTPSILRRQYSVMPDGEAYFCVALARVDHDPDQFGVTNAFSVGIGCRAEDAPRMAYSRGLKFENPERDGVKVGVTCRLCDRADCIQRSLPSFRMEHEINTINRKANVLAPIESEDLLLVAETPPADG